MPSRSRANSPTGPVRKSAVRSGGASSQARTTETGARSRRPPLIPRASGAPADPLLAALVHLFLPEGHVDFEDVDRVLARRKRVGAVRGADGDDDGRLAQLDSADAVVDAYLLHLVALLQAGGELLHHLLGHALVALVVEVGDDAPARLPPRRAGERRDRAGLLARDLLDDGVERDRLLRQDERAAGDGRDERDDVAVGERRVLLGVLLVHGVEQA